MERKALSSWNVAWAQSGSGLATSLLSLAPPQVLDDWIEAGWAFNFGSSAGMMVLSCSWNILRRVETNKLLIAANFPRWMNKVTDVFGRKQKHLRSVCVSGSPKHLLAPGALAFMLTGVRIVPICGDSGGNAFGKELSKIDTRIACCLHVSPSLQWQAWV